MPRPSKKATDDKAKAMPMPMPMPMPMAMPIQGGVVPAHTMVTPSVPGGMHHAPPPVPGATGGVQQQRVDHESFLRVRDSAVGRLTTILELLRSFVTDYLRQTNLLLGEHVEGSADFNAFESAAAQLIFAHADLGASVPEKKTRKKRTHDPEAPKRPLTPYFLYMKTARPIIANDLGPECPRGAVQEEGQRRWATMEPIEKEGWNTAYQFNLRLYNARVRSYKSGNPHAKDMSDEEAFKYAEEFGVPLPELKASTAPAETSVDDQDAIAEQLQQAISAGTSDEEDEGAGTMVKTPRKAGPSRKRKVATPATDMDASKQLLGGSPDKKRRRTSAKAAEQEEPKKSGRKKTKSS